MSGFWENVVALLFWWLITMPIIGLVYGITENVTLTSLLAVIWIAWGLWALSRW